MQRKTPMMVCAIMDDMAYIGYMGRVLRVPAARAHQIDVIHFLIKRFNLRSPRLDRRPRRRGLLRDYVIYEYGVTLGLHPKPRPRDFAPRTPHWRFAHFQSFY